MLYLILFSVNKDNRKQNLSGDRDNYSIPFITQAVNQMALVPFEGFLIKLPKLLSKLLILLPKC